MTHPVMKHQMTLRDGARDWFALWDNQVDADLSTWRGST
jgi:hypothetical protein